MAKLPDEFSLGRTSAPSNTPSVSVRAPDFSPLMRSAGAIGRGIQDLAGGFQAYADASAKIEDDDAIKRLIDFKTDTELSLEEHKRTMPETGIGFRESWNKEYDKRARKFFATVPKHLRKTVDMELVRHNSRLTKRAQHYEWQQNDRYESDSLEKSLSKITGIAAADPGRLKEMEQQGIVRIETARIPARVKIAAKQRFRTELAKQAVKSRIDAAISAEDYKALKKDLAPRTRSAQTAPRGRVKIKKAGDKFSHVVAGSGAKFRVSSSYAERFAGLVADLEAAGVKIDRTQSGGYANRNIAGTNKKSKHAFGAAIDINWTLNARGKPGNIRKVVGVAKIREIARRNGLKWGGDWRNPDDMHFEVDRRLTPQERAPEPAKSSGGGKSVYSGPYANLSLDQRRSLWMQAQARQKRQITALGNEISKLDGLAAEGKLPSDTVIADLAQRIQQTGDKTLAAKLTTVVGTADIMRKMYQSPPRVAAQFAQQQRDGVRAAMGDGRMTPEQDKALKRFDQAAETMRRRIKDDAMSWAHNHGVRVKSGPVKLEPLDFSKPDIDETIATRFRQAREVADYYQQPLQAFTKQEREALGDFVRRGGDGAKFILGKIVGNADKDAMRVISEFTKNAPEAYMIGSLIYDGASPKLIDEAVKEMKRRYEMGENYINKVDKVQAKDSLAEIAPALKNTPSLVDPVHNMANTIYNYRHRANGLSEFDADLYERTVMEVMGQTTDRNGVKYGGIGEQGGGWFDGKDTSIVVVPSGVRQDSFDEFVGAIRRVDYNVIGTPRYASGKPLSIADVQRARWLSLGNGRYGLQIGGDDENPDMAVGDDGSPFVLDTRKLIGRIQWRKPDLFQEYDPRADVMNSLTKDGGLLHGVSP